MLQAWLSDKFVQLQILYKVLFGVNFQTGLLSSNFPSDVVATVTTEVDLRHIFDLKPQQSFNLNKKFDKGDDIPTLIAEQNCGETNHNVLIDLIHTENLSLKNIQCVRQERTPANC